MKKIYSFIGYYMWYSKINKNAIFLDRKYINNNKIWRR